MMSVIPLEIEEPLVHEMGRRGMDISAGEW